MLVTELQKTQYAVYPLEQTKNIRAKKKPAAVMYKIRPALGKRQFLALIFIKLPCSPCAAKLIP